MRNAHHLLLFSPPSTSLFDTLSILLHHFNKFLHDSETVESDHTLYFISAFSWREALFPNCPLISDLCQQLHLEPSTVGLCDHAALAEAFNLLLLRLPVSQNITCRYPAMGMPEMRGGEPSRPGKYLPNQIEIL